MYIKCDCGQELITIESFDEDKIITFYVSSFYQEQRSWLYKLKLRLKSAWFMLSGKQYRLFDLCLSAEKFEELKAEINTL